MLMMMEEVEKVFACAVWQRFLRHARSWRNLRSDSNCESLLSRKRFIALIVRDRLSLGKLHSCLARCRFKRATAW
jgi:hypothetical protein